MEEVKSTENLEGSIEDVNREKTDNNIESKVPNSGTKDNDNTETNKSIDDCDKTDENPPKNETKPVEKDLVVPPRETPELNLGKGKRARIPNKRYSDILLSPQRSFKQSSENGEKVEMEFDDENVSNRLTCPAIKKQKLVDITNPNFLKPFKFGWKRELVYRANYDNSNRRIPGDIYYYSPQGKKIRSMRELSEILKTKELTLEDFTFTKEALGLDDPEKEIVRDAKPFQKKMALHKNTSKTSKVLSPKLPISKSKSSIGNESPKSTKGQTKGTPIAKSKTPNKVSVKAKGKSEEENMEVDTVNSRPKRKAAKTATSLESGLDGGKPCQQPCSIRCQGVLGMVVPTLQCHLCLCLYHNECVGLSPQAQIDAYICKNCQMEHGQTNVVTSNSAINLPPLTPINTLKAQQQLPKLQRMPLSTTEAETTNINTTTTTAATTTTTIITTTSDAEQNINDIIPKMPRLLPIPTLQTANNDNVDNNDCDNDKHSENNSLVGAVTTWLPHTSKIQVDNEKNKENNQPSRVLTSRPQYVEYLAGRKFLIIPKRNVVSISPIINNNYYDNEKLAIKEPEIIKNKENDINNEEQKEEENFIDAQLYVESPKSKKQRTSTKNDLIVGQTAQDEKTINFLNENYLQALSYGYKTLLHIFQYLKVQDILRASCVCHMWHDIASHPSLWRTVRMKNSQVHSFDGLAKSLKKHGSVHLDLRKMLLPTNSSNNGDDIWLEFTKAIVQVETLRKIELCRCPASVIEQLPSTNPNLEVINAVTIKCEKMSLETLSSLKNLKELRLKSTNGLILTSDLSALKELKNLKILTLTSIKDLDKIDLSVIGDLVNLESLDLGECTNFPKTFGEDILIKLTKLEKLRLEKGQDNCHTFEILDAVKQMKHLEQLELINFDIKPGFDIALGSCSNLKKLLLIPTYISQSATTNHMVLGGVLRLQTNLSYFVWGVTLELLRVTELFMDQCDDNEKKEKKDKKSTGDSIPVLKPVPLIKDNEIVTPPAEDPPQVTILPLVNLQKLFLQCLPMTRVKILKIPFHATWRQSINDTVNL